VNLNEQDVSPIQVPGSEGPAAKKMKGQLNSPAKTRKQKARPAPSNLMNQLTNFESSTPDITKRTTMNSQMNVGKKKPVINQYELLYQKSNRQSLLAQSTQVDNRQDLKSKGQETLYVKESNSPTKHKSPLKKP